MMPSRTLVASLWTLMLASSAAYAQAPQGRDQTADQQVLHALNRLAFGPRPGEAARVRAMGVDQWIAAQLAPARIADTAADRAMQAYPGLAMDQAEISRLYREQVRERRMAQQQGEPAQPAADPAMSMQERRRARARDEESAGRRLNAAIGDVAAARIARAVVSERQLQEVMADFWANHFSVARNKGQTRLYLGHYDQEVIRPHAMGKFRDLLGAVAKSPAMLFYLDNARSVADQSQRPARQRAARRQPPVSGDSQLVARISQPPRGINENYARELLELHTLGVDAGYTQQDVMETARALTGWSIDPQRGEFTFRRAAHDRGAKTVLGTRLPAGRGIEDGEQVLDLVARHPSTARHIARKLVIRFVSDSPPPSLVERAAATFTRTDGDITETVRTIVTSDEFFSQAAYRAKVKTPFELVASTYRVLGQVPDSTPRTVALLGRLGQPVFGRQTPDGWPETGDEWMTAGSILARINFGLLVAGARIPGIRLADWEGMSRLRTADCGNEPRRTGTRAPGPVSAVRSPQSVAGTEAPGPVSAIRSPQSAVDCVDIVVSELLGGAVSVETREILASGSNPLLARAPAPAAMDSTVVSARGLQLSPLQQLVGLALGAPEFQRR